MIVVVVLWFCSLDSKSVASEILMKDRVVEHSGLKAQWAYTYSKTPSQLVLIVSSVENGIAIISKITLRGGAKEINGVALFYPM